MMFQADAKPANMNTPASVRSAASSATAGAARAEATATTPAMSPRLRSFICPSRGTRLPVSRMSRRLDAGFVEGAAEQARRAHDQHRHEHREGDGVDERAGEVLAAP